MGVPRWIDLRHQSLSKVMAGLKVITGKPTRRHIIFHHGAGRSSTINLHGFLTLESPFLSLQPFAFALLSKNSLQILCTAARILRVGRVLKRPGGG
jgi:hypothetical protein